MRTPATIPFRFPDPAGPGRLRACAQDDSPPRDANRDAPVLIRTGGPEAVHAAFQQE